MGFNSGFKGLMSFSNYCVFVSFVKSLILKIFNYYGQYSKNKNFYKSFINSVKGKGKDKRKGKAITLQVRTNPECSSRLRLPDFKTIGT